MRFRIFMICSLITLPVFGRNPPFGFMSKKVNRPVSTLNTGLVSFWDLEEASGTRADFLGLYSLTDTGSTGVSSGSGRFGNGALFDGTNNQYLSVSPPIAGDVDFTASCWLYTPGMSATAFIMGVYDNDGGINASWEVYTTGSGGTVHFAIHGSGGANGEITASATSADGWLLIVARYSTTLSAPVTPMTLDVIPGDGSTPGHTTTNSHLDAKNSSAQFTIGMDSIGHYNCGTIVDAGGLWSRMLTDGEVTELFTGGQPTF